MSAQHTPGPWLIEAGVCHSGDIATVYNTTEKWVTIYAPNWIETGLNQHEQSANARLIAAAPDLLAALNAVLPYAEETQDEGPDGYGWKSDDLRKAIALASAAIAKVEQR